MKTKKIMALVLCLCMLLASIPFTVLAATPNLTLTYVEYKELATTYETGTRFILSDDDGTQFFGGSSRADYSIQRGDFADLKDFNAVRTLDTDTCTLIHVGIYGTGNHDVYRIATEYTDTSKKFLQIDDRTIVENPFLTEKYLRESTVENDLGKWVFVPIGITSEADPKPLYRIYNYADNSFYLDLSDNSLGLDIEKINNVDNAQSFRIFAEISLASSQFLYEDGDVFEEHFGAAEVPDYPINNYGYDFVGWSTDPDGNGVIVKPGTTINPDEPEVYYPIFRGITYEIRFYADEADIDTSKYVSQEMTYGETQALRKNTFTKSHNDFAYWTMDNWADPRGIGTGTFADEEKVRDLSATQGDVVVLYATWEEYSYTVLYSGNGADTTEVPFPATYKYSRVFRLSDGEGLVKDGYRFVGWNTKADGTGDMYSAGQMVSRLCEEKDGKVTLFATWVKDSAYCDHTVNEKGAVTKQATCTETGTIEYRCTKCGDLLNSETIPALGHGSNGEYKIVHKDTTCNKSGVDLYICKICNMPYRSEAVDKAGHVASIPETLIQATCTHTGIKIVKCSECGALLQETVIPKLDHTIETVTEKHATCSQTGLKVEKCSICDYVAKETQIPKTEHTPGAWKITKDCTCTEDGLKQQTCSVCGALIGEPVTIAAHEHQAGAWETSIKPTCTTEGEKVKVCTVCNAVVESAAIAKTEHTKGEFLIEKAATCTEAGLKVQKCETCGIVLADEEISAKGHHEGTYYLTVDKPSCNNAGERVYYCDVCGAPVRTEAVEKRGHVEGAWVTTLEPTCTRKGHQKKSCEVCGVTLDERDVDAPGHTEGVWITTLEPTCVTAGEKVCNCDTCGKAYKSERIDPLGHTPGPEETCVDDQICLVCYVVLEKADGRSHTWTEWATYEEAGYFTERVERRFCTSCNNEEFRYVSGTAGCHNCFPHSDDPDNCGACNVLHSVNSFFRSVGKVLTFIFFGNIGTNVLFPWLHTHFHTWFNPYK